MRDRIIAGIIDYTPANQTNYDNQVAAFFSSTRFGDKAAIFFLRLLTESATNEILMTRTHFQFYKAGTFNRRQYLRDLDNGKVDIYPYHQAIGIKTLERFTVVSTFDINELFFYSSIKSSNEAYVAPFSFLTAPFHWRTWACFLVLFLVCLFIREGYGRFPHFVLESSRIVRISGLFLLGAFTISYSSKLRAIIMETKYTMPFQNLYDLSTKIEQRELSIILDTRFSIRYFILTKPWYKDYRTEPLERLYQAVMRTPGSVTVMSSRQEICSSLKNRSGEVLFMGYEMLMADLCPNLPFWRYPILEYQLIPQAVLLSKRRPVQKLAERANLIGMAALAYRDLLISRKRRASKSGRVKSQNQQQVIGISSVIGAFMVLIIGWVSGTAIFALEFWRRKYRGNLVITYSTP